MKILFITDLYPIKHGETSTPKTLHSFVKEWIKQGHEVNVIRSNFVFNSILRSKPFYKNGFYELDGVRIANLNYFTPFCLDFMNKIPSEIKDSKYDVIVAHMPAGIILANKIAKVIDVPLVCAVHNSDLEVLTNPLYSIYFSAQLRRAYEVSSKIACRSFVLEKKFRKLMPHLSEKTFVAASGVEESVLVQKTFPIKIGRSNFTVLTCANLIKRKNVDKLILAINDLIGFNLKIIGDGPELGHLKAKVAKNKNIEFLDRLPNNQVLEEMKKSDIFVLPSVNETFGMVYLEAMACGCITVCTKDDGIDGIIIDGENGFLCEPSVEGIKSVLLKIMASNSSALGKIQENALETLDKYSIKNCASNYIENIKASK